MVGNAKWVNSYFHLGPENRFLHKSICRSPSIPLQMKLAPTWSASPTANSPPAPAGCWQKGSCGHLPTSPGRISQVSQYWLFQLSGLFGSFLLSWAWMQLQQQAISSAVAEAALSQQREG